MPAYLSQEPGNKKKIPSQYILTGKYVAGEATNGNSFFKKNMVQKMPGVT